MNKNVIYYPLIILIIFSCKKSTNNTNSVSSNNNSSGSYSYGYLKATRQYNIYGNTLYFIANGVLAYFFSNPPNQSSEVAVGSVWIDTTKLRYDNIGIAYLDSTYQIHICPTKWNVVGAGAIPSFTYTNNDSLPGFTGYTLLPDSLDKTQSYTVQVNGVSGADGIELMLSDGLSLSPPHAITKFSFTISTNNTFAFSTADLSGLNSMPNAQLQITLTKSNTQTFSGKKFYFTSETQINKFIKIK